METREFDLAVASKGLYKRAKELGAITKNYTGLLTVFGAVKYAFDQKDDEVLAECAEYLKLYQPGAEYNLPSFDCYIIGGNPKAYLLMNEKYDKSELDIIREYAEITMDAVKSDDGIIAFRRHPERWIWVDAISGVAPYMTFAGLALNEPRYLDFAAEQTIKLYDALVNPENDLVHQSRGILGKGVFSQDHWSRGNGWMMIGFSELIEYLPKDNKFYNDVVDRFKRLCKALLPYISIRGLWRQEITMEGAWEESSGTALLAYGIGVGLRMGILPKDPYLDVFKKAIWGLCEYCITDNYNTYHSCPGCNTPGEGETRGSQESYVCLKYGFRNEPHSFGPMILALNEAVKNGIPSVEKMPQFDWMTKYGE